MLGLLFKDSVIYGLGRYLSALVALFLIPVYTRLIPPDQYGALELFGTLNATLMVFAVLGTDTGLALCYYQSTDRDERSRYVSTALLIRVALSLLVAAGGFFLAPVIDGHLFGGGGYTDLLRWTFGVFPLQMLQVFSLDVLRLRLQPWRYSFLNLLGVLTTTGVGISLVVGLKAGVAGLVIANAVAAVAMGVVGVALMGEGLSTRFTLPYAKRLLAYGLPLVPASMASWVILFGDRYFMSHYLDLAQIGVYAIGLKIASIMTLATSSFQLAWGPFALSIKDRPNAKETYARIFSFYALGGVSGAVLLGLFAPEILRVLVSPDYAGAGAVTGILVLVPVVIGAYYIVSIGINIVAKTSYISLTTALAAFVSVLLNAILIPRLGIVGVGIASLAAQGVSAAALYFLSQRLYPIPYDPIRVLGLLFVGGGTLLLGSGLSAGAIGLKALIVLGYALVVALLVRRAPSFAIPKLSARLAFRLPGQEG